MYRVLIVCEDSLMQEALEVMVLKSHSFKVVEKVSTGERAIQVCRDNVVDIVFIDMAIPCNFGIEISERIHKMYPEISIYMLSVYAKKMFMQNVWDGTIKEVLEKPLSYGRIKALLSDFKTEHEGSAQSQIEELIGILNAKNFEKMYYAIPRIVDEIYLSIGMDSAYLIKTFSYIGQSLLNTIGMLEDDNKVISELFPLNEGLISDKKSTELWIFRVMNYIFQKNSIDRYPVLDDVFLFIENHIKEDINLNQIVENCAISQGYLSRIFKKQFQISVMDYLHMRKIHLAKGYFYYTEDSIGEIAFRLGYNESSYFSKVFKKYEHMTGKEYRTSIKKSCAI